MAKRLTPEGRANHFSVHVEAAIFLALLLKALRRQDFCEIPLTLGALAKDYGAIADDQQDPLVAMAELPLESLQALVADLGQPCRWR